MNIVGKFNVLNHEFDIYGSIKEPLFLAVDIAKIIDYSIGNVSHMLDCVDESEKIIIKVKMLESHGRNNNTSINTRNVTKEKWFLTE